MTTPENPKITNELFQLKNIELFIENQNEYYEDALKRVNQGEEVLVIRSFEADSGIVLDYFKDSKYVGFIDYEYGVGADIYIDEKLITENPVDLEHAIKALQRSVVWHSNLTSAK